MNAVIIPLGQGFLSFLHELGGLTRFYGSILKTIWKTDGNLKAINAQIAYVAYRSIPTVIFGGVFVGAILLVQFMSILGKYDATSLIGGLNTASIVREVGPWMISFLLAGKIGAFTAAELGTMKVTEQIDAIKCLGTDPVQYLIVPRFVAIVFTQMILVVMAMIISVTSAMLMADAMYGINTLQYVQTIPKFSDGGTVLAGMFKTFVYGVIVAGVACYKGFTASGGAKGVGKAVTSAAIYTNFYIVVANYITTNIIIIVEKFYRHFVGGAL